MTRSSPAADSREVRATELPPCPACGNSAGDRPFTAREMMFGTRAEFEYAECIVCGCIRIAHVPDDLARFYPSEYYSLRPSARESALKRVLRRSWTRHAAGKRTLLGGVINKLRGAPPFLDWIRRAGVAYDDRVLDVGCGSGLYLRQMHSAGFRDLTGIDPFLDHDHQEAKGLVRLKRTLEEVDGPFDFVMLHHSFEHMPDPVSALAGVHRVLRPGRFALVRVPVAGSFAWREYRADWVQLDPPRHLFIPTPAGMRLLAVRCGFDVVDVVYDSYGLQFWGSEQYRRGIPLSDLRSIGRGWRFLVNRAELRRLDARARSLNASGEGDQACFYLRKH